MSLRQQEIVLADGRFRVVLTDRRRLFAVLDATETALGPLRVALEIDRGPLLDASASPSDGARAHTVSGVSEAGDLRSEQAFHLLSAAAPAIAPSAFATLRDAVDRGAHVLNENQHLLPDARRSEITAAARVVLRARLGDIAATRFIRRVVAARRAGANGRTREIGESLLAGGRFLDEALRSTSAIFDVFGELVGALQGGDLRRAESVVAESRTKALAAEAQLLDEYVRLFGQVHAPSRSEGSDEREPSSRFAELPSRPITTTTGFSVGDAIGIAGDAASGNVAGAVGDAGGAIGGSLAKGAAIGGAIGSVIPGIGTAIGGAVGAVIGGIGSLFGGHHHSGPIDFEHMIGGLGVKMARQIADKIRQAPRWQAHFQAVYRHLPAGTANMKGLGDLVARELFPHDQFGKDATTGHPDGLAEWFAEQPDWERLLHSPGVPPGDRHQLEARIHAAANRIELGRRGWEILHQHGHPTEAPRPAASHPAPVPPRVPPELMPSWEPVAALPVTTGCACDPSTAGES